MTIIPGNVYVDKKKKNVCSEMEEGGRLAVTVTVHSVFSNTLRDALKTAKNAVSRC